MFRYLGLLFATLIFSACSYDAYAGGGPSNKLDFEAGLGPTIHGRCHMEYCGFATITTAKLLAELPDGALYKIDGLGWSADYKRRDGAADEYAFPPTKISGKEERTFQVFCSKARPWIFYPDGKKWQAVPLRPGDEEAIFGYSESSYSDYWAACHHFFPRSAYDPLIKKLAPKLGYYFHGGWPNGNEPDDIKQPSDLSADVSSALQPAGRASQSPLPTRSAREAEREALFQRRHPEPVFREIVAYENVVKDGDAKLFSGAYTEETLKYLSKSLRDKQAFYAKNCADDDGGSGVLIRSVSITRIDILNAKATLLGNDRAKLDVDFDLTSNEMETPSHIKTGHTYDFVYEDRAWKLDDIETPLEKGYATYKGQLDFNCKLMRDEVKIKDKKTPQEVASTPMPSVLGKIPPKEAEARIEVVISPISSKIPKGALDKHRLFCLTSSAVYLAEHELATKGTGKRSAIISFTIPARGLQLENIRIKSVDDAAQISPDMLMAIGRNVQRIKYDSPDGKIWHVKQRINFVDGVGLGAKKESCLE